MPRTLSRTKRARKNLALKLMLENRFTPEVRTYFNNVVREFKVFYSATGDPLPRESYGDDTVSLLNKQYKRVSKAFSTELREDLLTKPNSRIKGFWAIEIKQDEIVTEEQAATIAAILSVFTKESANQRSRLIDQTTERDITDSISKARIELSESGEELTNATIAAAAALILKRKFLGREGTIVMTETQFMAENTKGIEAAVLFGVDDVNVGAIATGASILGFAAEGQKTWSSVLDQVTRSSHVEADGQQQNSSDPFIVQGERLQYPSDTSLGASASNVINCRCSSLYGL